MLRTPPLPGASADNGVLVAVKSLGGLAVVLIALTVFRLWAASRLGLIPDETYYWLWSRAPSWGYYDHPPMIAWWIWLSTHVLGPTPLGIRLLPVLSVLGVSVAVYGTARELLGDSNWSGRSALWVNAMFLIGGGAIFATPDAPSILFWSLGVWTLARIRNRSEARLWLVLGVLAGLGCVSKYTNLFLGPGVILWLLVDPMARRWLASPWLYAGGLVAAMVFAPVVLWNADHHWVSFAKQFGRIDDGHLTLRYLGEFLLGQFGLLNPLIAVLAVVAATRIRLPRDKGELSAEGFLLAIALPLIVYMVIHSFHGRVLGNWPGPIYSTIALLAAAAVDGVKGANLRRMISFVAPVGIVPPLIALACFGIAREDQIPFPSPVDLLIGWPDLSNRIEALRLREHADWIATADYGLTGELEYHTGGRHLVQEIRDRNRYSYDNPDPSLATRSALLILRDQDKKNARILACFDAVTPLGPITRMAGSRVIESYHLFKMSGGPDLLSRGCQPG